MPPLVVEIMALSGPRSADPNGSFFLQSEPLSPLFITWDPFRVGRSIFLILFLHIPFAGMGRLTRTML
jgi:hypothetical protein